MIRAYWIADMARALLAGDRLRFYVALGQLERVNARERF